MRPLLEIALVLAAALVPGVPTPLVGMLIATSVLRALSPPAQRVSLFGASWRRDLAVGLVVGTLAYIMIAVVGGSAASSGLHFDIGLAQGRGAVVLAVAIALAAEMVFRGFILQRLELATESFAAANLLSALAFAWILGDSDPGASGGLFIMGIGFGLLYRASGRTLLLPAFTHIALAVASVVISPLL